jgi:mono/diheme cytochrome c family protein
MKRVKKILKWTGIILLFIIVSVTALTASRQQLMFEAPSPNIKASTDSTIIARGKHLVYSSAHCASCHSNQNADSLLLVGIEPELSGGHEFKLPIGSIYAKNITSDKETGIGNLTDAQIARALYYGVGHDGRAMFDFMPFHHVSETDMQAIISYIRTQKPVRNKVPGNNFNTLGKVVKAFMLKPTGPTKEIPETIIQDTSAAYGSYLVNNVANCTGCHTKRDPMTGAYMGPVLAGGMEFNEAGAEPLITPNLTTDSSSRIFGWNYEVFKSRFKMGRIVKHSPMPWESYKRMTDDEIKAVFNYLQTVEPAKIPLSKPLKK